MITTTKKVLRLLLVLTLVFTLSISAIAINIDTPERATQDIDTITSRVGEMLPYLPEFPQDSRESVYLGERLASYLITDSGDILTSEYEVYPILQNNSIVGLANVIKINGAISQVSCGIEYAPELQQCLSSNRQSLFAIIYSNNGVYVGFPSGSITCLKQYQADTARETEIKIDKNEMTFASVSQAKMVTLVPQTRDTIYNGLSVTNVSNTSTSCCPSGICGHACMAMMINYYKKVNFTALNIHSLCGCLTSNYHNQEKTFLNKYGLTVTGPNYSFSFPYVRANIDANKLMLLDLQASGGVAHNVVVRGYIANTSSPTTSFYFMDPNNGNNICNFPANAYDPFYVPASGYNFNIHCDITGVA